MRSASTSPCRTLPSPSAVAMSRNAGHEPTSLHAMSTGTTAARLVCSMTAWSIDSDGASPNGSALRRKKARSSWPSRTARSQASSMAGLMRDSSPR